MSLGNDEVGDVEKFPAKCSICKNDTKVPFKPEPGRPVYCRDCISKLKSGELKPVKGSINQIRYDESKFFKPLSDLGIEFQSKDVSGQMEKIENDRYPERGEKNFNPNVPQNGPQSRPNVFSKIKKAFVKNDFSQPRPVQKKVFNNSNFKNTPKPKVVGENLALREILNKTLNESKILDVKEEVKKEEPKMEEIKKEAPPAISLNELRVPKSTVSTLEDRSASADDMNKLKDLISKVPPVNKPAASPAGRVREVPEDVLRKILE